jgi:hypothetical protein
MLPLKAYKAYKASEQTLKELEFLIKFYGENQSQLVKRLIAEKYLELNHKEKNNAG